MPERIRWTGSRAALRNKLRLLPGFLAGKVEDPLGLVKDVNLVLGVALLGKVQDDYILKAAGGHGEVGAQWSPLAATTLALRNKGTQSQKVADKLKADFAKLPKHRQNLVAVQYQRLKDLYEAGNGAGARARSHARRLLEMMKPYISKSRYKRLEGELSKPLAKKKAERLALLGAHALILRDTGRLLNSLSPGIKGPDQVNETQPGGKIAVGSNVDYLKYHQSPAPRKLKKDGKPKLPRRQVLPDETNPIPPRWWSEMLKTYSHSIATRSFMKNYLGNEAA